MNACMSEEFKVLSDSGTDSNAEDKALDSSVCSYERS